jgi:hypothetical protein
MVAKFPFEIIDNGVIYAFRIAFRGREKLNTLSTLQNNIRQPGVIIDLLMNKVSMMLHNEVYIG